MFGGRVGIVAETQRAWNMGRGMSRKFVLILLPILPVGKDNHLARLRTIEVVLQIALINERHT